MHLKYNEKAEASFAQFLMFGRVHKHRGLLELKMLIRMIRLPKGLKNEFKMVVFHNFLRDVGRVR